MTKKILLFVLIISLFYISCKKEKLKDETSILIGEWQQTNYMNTWIFGCEIDTLDTSNSPNIIFNKKGGIFIKKNGTEEKYLIRFKNNNEDSRTDKKEFSCDYPIILDSIENFYTFKPEITQRFKSEVAVPVIYVNENKLIIVSNSGEIISPPCETCMDDHTGIHFFKKVN